MKKYIDSELITKSDIVALFENENGMFHPIDAACLILEKFGGDPTIEICSSCKFHIFTGFVDKKHYVEFLEKCLDGKKRK